MPSGIHASVAPARYIAFEGGEGVGKSTQARLLAARVGGAVTREPGGTPLGVVLRRILLGTAEAPVGARAETLLMAADRAQHLDEVVLPLLDSGTHVISDRSAFSSLAYQGGGRDLGVAAVRALNGWALRGRWPDAVVLLQVAPDVARERMGRELDRLEREGHGFHARVEATFDELASSDTASRWHRVDASPSPDEVAEAVWSALADLFTGTGS